MPAVMMAVMLTGKPFKTLLLDRLPSGTTCVVAVALACLAHPIGMQLSSWIRELYPVQEETRNKLEGLGQLLQTAPYEWLPYVLLAVLPAVCEELAFRGFILSGLRHLGSKRWAIGLSAVFFGLAHGLIQQSVHAAALGILIGYVAVQTGSLIPGMLFHMTYNALGFASALLPDFAKQHGGWSALFREAAPGQILYNWPVLAICAAAAIVPLVWLHRLPYQATREEQIYDARARQPHHPLPAGASTAE
jgi:sodium transport system permease protein